MKSEVFFNEFRQPDVIPSVPGSPSSPVYRLDPLSDEVIQDGEENIQDLINAAADSVDVHKILARFNQTQDETLLRIRSTIEGDLTVFPGSVQEAQMRLRELQEIYSENPELRALFKDFADFSRRGLTADAWKVKKEQEAPAVPEAPKKLEGDQK